MKKYLQISIVLAVFLIVVLLHDLSGSGRKLVAAEGKDMQTGSAFPAPISATPDLSGTSSPAAASITSEPTPGTTATPTLQGGVASPLAQPPIHTSSLPPPTLTPVSTPNKAGLYKDGTYTGPPANAYYGYVQVKAVVANGRLMDVKFLQYPNHTRTSQMINAQVMPMLTQEAVKAQNASINVISGASATSYAFAQSLNSALNQAR